MAIRIDPTINWPFMWTFCSEQIGKLPKKEQGFPALPIIEHGEKNGFRWARDNMGRFWISIDTDHGDMDTLWSPCLRECMDRMKKRLGEKGNWVDIRQMVPEQEALGEPVRIEDIGNVNRELDRSVI